MNRKNTNHLIFAQEPPKATPITKQQMADTGAQAPWKLMVVDDDADIHAVTRLVLEGLSFQNRRLQILNVNSAQQAQTLLQEHPDIHLALLDVVMETDDAGLQLVDYIRNTLGNDLIRLLLRTGQPGQAPESHVINDYDINGYLEKSELTAQKLTSAITMALRNHAELSLQQQRLHDLQVHADTAHKVKDAFLANISHEVRTPLTAIQGFAETLLQNKLEPKQASALNIIIESSQHLTNLIESLLSLSKLDAGAYEVQLSTFNCLHFFIEIINTTKHFAEASGVQFICDIAQPIPQELHTDSQILRQVLLHLLNNAIKFGANGVVVLKVSYSDNLMLFEIEDNGMGMSNLEHTNMLNAFQQGQTRGNKNSGLGIGLTLSQKYLNLLNTELHFSPNIPHGCRFSFSLELPEQVEWNDTSSFKTKMQKCAVEKHTKIQKNLPIAPPKEKLENLYELALKGYLQDIADEAERLHEWDMRFHPFADELRRLSENFEKTELCKYLKRYIEG